MGKERISSQEIADYTNINATQIRRDLSNFGKFGKRGVGYSIDGLLGEIRKILRTQGQHNIALVGAGRLGQAIAGSPIFAEHGITIAAVFDTDERRSSARRSATSRSSTYARLKDVVHDKNIVVGVLAVPAAAAQQVAERPRRRRRADHLQLLRGAARRARPTSPCTRRTRPSSCCTRSTSTSTVAGRRPSTVRILLWHGYLLGGTGSNVYTRALAREWSRAGHDVTVVCQERAPEHYDLGGARGRAARAARAGCCRCSCSTATRGSRRGCCRTSPPDERRRYVEANVGALRELLPADLVFTNHVLMGGAGRRRAPASAFRVKAHGSELEYSMRGRPELEAWGRETLAPAEAVFVGSQHIREVLEDVVGHVDRVVEVPPGRRRRRVRRSQARDEALADAARRGARATRRTPATRASGCPTRATPPASRRSSPATGRPSSTSGS